MSEQEVIKTNCRSCAQRTRHEVLHAHVVEVKEEFFNETDTWQIIRCLGCFTVAFRHQRDDFDDVEEKPDGTVQHAVHVKTYPRVINNHRGLASTYYLPTVIKNVYEQTLRALGDQALVLASIGLRACIEATCNELNVSATNLEKRIDQLFKAGHVSNADKKRLHAIRFLGNDAAHDIKEPSQADIRVALEIVEHLLNTVFILERKAARLELVAETYDEFISLVRACASRYESANAISLVGLLGSRKRLVGNQLDAFEAQLLTDLAAGQHVYLKLGASQNVAGKDVQLYEVDRGKALEDDDIPF